MVKNQHLQERGESFLAEVISGFPTYGLPLWILLIAGTLLTVCIVAYSLAGKGTGSHAGREEIRRSYRRELAKQMAKQDAKQIEIGNKPRRRWMQW